MPIVDHNNAPEVPWRPNYRKWLITQEGDGTTSTEAAISEVGVGTGAPLHTHEDDELIVVLSGTLSVRYGDETHEVGAITRSSCLLMCLTASRRSATALPR